ncbi:MAG TPA: hypothetical protein PKH77_28100 [Anaerolineae bacterium]|nr:hypothetical protein [Anaerolineae bacterium]
MRTITITFGLFCTLLALALSAMVVATSCEAWAIASASKVASYEETRQVEIMETQLTERTRIQSDERVRIEEIRSDTSKKTSFFFSMFFLLRAFIWLAIIAAGLWVAVLVRENKKVENHDR